MFLSKIEFVDFSKNLLRDISSRYKQHQFVMSAFPDNMNKGDDRIMFRHEGKTILVQSHIKPDWEKTNAKYGYIKKFAVKEFEPNFANGSSLKFRLIANPTVNKRGKRVSIHNYEDIMSWMVRKSKNGGFKLTSLTVGQNTNIKTREKNMTHSVVEFNGTLIVTDSNIFYNSIAKGIGRAKAFGCGLLSVARVQQ